MAVLVSPLRDADKWRVAVCFGPAAPDCCCLLLAFTEVQWSPCLPLLCSFPLLSINSSSSPSSKLLLNYGHILYLTPTAGTAVGSYPLKVLLMAPQTLCRVGLFLAPSDRLPLQAVPISKGGFSTQPSPSDPKEQHCHYHGLCAARLSISSR